MKVLDLQCGQQHVFEGWFASEGDFISQCERGLVVCPVCGNASISKKLSAPRLNLRCASAGTPSATDTDVAMDFDSTLQVAWMAVARGIVANTDDVGERFAEEARRIHYGESKARGIRGKASRAETESLMDEGIAVMPLLLPDVLKGTLQ